MSVPSLHFTPREWEFLTFYCDACHPSDVVAYKMGVSLKTVEALRTNLMKKTRSKNARELVARFHRGELSEIPVGKVRFSGVKERGVYEFKEVGRGDLKGLSPGHPLRNAPLIDIGAEQRCGARWRKIEPSWPIANKTYNDLGPAWTEYAEWRAT